MWSSFHAGDNTTRPHKPDYNLTLGNSEVIAGFTAQGIHRIHYIVRPRLTRQVLSVWLALLELDERVSPGHEVRPWSYNIVNSTYSLRVKPGITFELLRLELLSGLCALVALSLAWKTTRSRFNSQ